MKKLWILAVVVAAVSLVAVWFVDRGGIFPTKEIRYRYEVTVDTPDGQMTGYSVHRLVIQDTTMTPARNYQVELDGEAVPFILPDGRVLFATLRSKGGAGPQQLFAMTVSLSHSGRWIDAPEQFNALVRADNWPSLAIIEKRDAPASLRWVSDDEEYRVLDARMISTDEVPSEKVAHLLPWLVDFISAAPYSSRQMTDLHLLAFALKVGVRS